MGSIETLHLINSLGAGGAERSLAELLSELPRWSIHPTVAIFDRTAEGVEQSVRDAGVEVVHVTARGWFSRAREVRRLLSSRRVELLHTTLFEADVVGRIAAAGSAVPVLTSLVNTSYDPIRLADLNVRRSRLRAAQLVEGVTARIGDIHFHAISETVRRSAIQHLRLPPDRITVVPRGRARSRLGEPGAERRAVVRHELGLPVDATVLLHVGREEFQKGHSVLLDAVGPLLESRPELHLILAGRRGNSSARIDHYLERLPSRQVHRLGHRDDVPDLLAAADVFVFPSLYEGLGGAVLEAMAMELPVISSDLAALRETLAASAVFVRTGAVDELRHTIGQLVEDPARRRRLGSAGRRRFEEHYDHDHVSAEMAELLSRCAVPRQDRSRS